MRNRIIVLKLFLSIALLSNAQVKNSGYAITPVSFTSVKVGTGFWGQRLKANRNITIPLAFEKCEKTGRYLNFERAAHPCDTFKIGGFPFDDTDVYKTIEGASYSMQTYPNKKMEKYIDSILTIVAAAQESDGYLYTARTMNPAHPHAWSGHKRWETVEDGSHEFYNLGHMLEGAVAHYQATGKKNFLNIAIKYADCICREIGTNQNQQIKIPGHQIAEMGLVKLYLVTKNKKYLDQAKFFLDQRGHTKHINSYNQSHKPVIEQDEAVGHAVRAVYMYSGMADVAALTNDSLYIRAIDKIWDNIVSKKYYITGGIGARHNGEAFGDNYELPNAEAYCETCAAIGFVYMNYRLFLLHGEAKYYDVLERTLYNALIDGVSIDGGRFFYPNPLASKGGYDRQPWFGCACCPSNISRFIPSLPGYIYAQKDNNVFVNLFLNNSARLAINGKKVVLEQKTDYPLNGDIYICVKEGKGLFNLKIRIPGWVRNQVVPSDLYNYCDDKQLNYYISVNGIKQTSEIKNGYFDINQKWKKGDLIKIHFDMNPRIVKALDKVVSDKGRISVEYGPLVYCAEWPDNKENVESYLLPKKPVFNVSYNPNLLGGINIISTSTVQSLKYESDGSLSIKTAKLNLIPYYAWDHRSSKGAMTVWIANELFTVQPSKK